MKIVYKIKNIELIIKCYIITFLFLNNFSLHGQTLNQLDNKKGFKIFILGTPIENYREFYKLQFLEQPFEKEGKKYLNIKDTEYNKIGDIPLKNINLQFIKGNLTRIQVEIDYKYSDYLYKILEEAYGIPNSSPYYTKNDSFQSISSAEWSGQSVSLKLNGNGNLNNLSRVELTFSFKNTKKAIENKVKNGANDL